ncbi:MAG TPA: DNA repair protein RecO [Candidatus Scybalocola faecipullorum]|nr:DNA repair protein RecO [Candidatus Scybalocola faecipullorum]
MERLILTGMVISAMPVGEYDKRLVFLTRERGKITAFSRGSRRQNSTMLGATEPFVFGKFHFLEGRNAYTLVQAEPRYYFMELRQSFELACYGFYFLEFTSYYARENEDGTQMLGLLVQTMRILCKNVISPKLIRRIFELKLMVINGEYPQVFQCVKCGREGPFAGFSPSLSGLVCPLCQKYGGTVLPASESTVYTMQYIISSPVEKLYTFTVSEQVLSELSDIIDRHMNRYIDKKFNSLQMLSLV